MLVAGDSIYCGKGVSHIARNVNSLYFQCPKIDYLFVFIALNQDNVNISCGFAI